jgi:hypothetical protein
MIKLLNKAQYHEKGMQLHLPWLGGEDKNLEQGFIIFGPLDTYFMN